MAPTVANGKICSIEIPAVDIQRSVDFCAKVFGCWTRRRGERQIAFDHTTGEVSGTWVLGRPASSHPGLLVYIMRTTRCSDGGQPQASSPAFRSRSS